MGFRLGFRLSLGWVMGKVMADKKGKGNEGGSLLDKLNSVNIKQKEQSWVSRVLEILPQIEEKLEAGAVQADIARAFGCSPRAFSSYIREARQIAGGVKPKRTVGRPRRTTEDYKATVKVGGKAPQAVQDKPTSTGGYGGYTPVSRAPAAAEKATQAAQAQTPAAPKKPGFNFRSDTSAFIEDDDDL